MSTYPCPDCRHIISTKAYACPTCGRPNRAQPTNVLAIVLTIILFVVIALAIVSVFMH